MSISREKRKRYPSSKSKDALRLAILAHSNRLVNLVDVRLFGNLARLSAAERQLLDRSIVCRGLDIHGVMRENRDWGSVAVSKIQDWLGGNTTDGRLGLDVFSHYGTGKDNCSASNRDASEDRDAGADPAILLDDNWLREGGSPTGSANLVVNVMGGGADASIRANIGTATNLDGRIIVNGDSASSQYDIQAQPRGGLVGRIEGSVTYAASIRT